MPPTPVKLAMGGDTRRVELRQESWSLAELLEHIDGAFGGSGEGQLQLSYIDSEGDRCAIGWDQELTEAQRDAEEDGRLLKIIVEEGSAATAAQVGVQTETASPGEKDRALAPGPPPDNDAPALRNVAIPLIICIAPILALLAGVGATIYARWTDGTGAVPVQLDGLANEAVSATAQPLVAPALDLHVAQLPQLDVAQQPRAVDSENSDAEAQPLSTVPPPPPSSVLQHSTPAATQSTDGHKDASATRPAQAEAATAHDERVQAAMHHSEAEGTQEEPDRKPPLHTPESSVTHPIDRTFEKSDAMQQKAHEQVAKAVARKVAREEQPTAESLAKSTPTAHEHARRSRARESARHALNSGNDVEVAQLDDEQDAAAFAEYLRRGNTGKMVLKVLIPVYRGVTLVQISAGVDVRLAANVPDTRWNGSFIIGTGGALALQQLRFEDHFAQRQGSVASNNGTMTVVGCRFLTSASMGVGGVLVNREGGVMFIRDSWFEANRAMFGGAVFNFNGDLFIEGSTFRDNHAETAGGAVALGPNAQLSIVSCNFIQNRAGADGDTGAQLGAAVIWSLHPDANCANGTSACWDNGLDIDIWTT